MERLTTKRNDGRWAIKNDEGATPLEQINKISIAIDRLAAYEETSLDPEEVAELVSPKTVEISRLLEQMCTEGSTQHMLELFRAEKDGRLVVLPCKVGDTVYIPLHDGVHGVRVMGIRISANGKDTVLHLDIGSGGFRWGSDKGRTWFSTQKEAEAAMKKRKR